MIGSVLGTIGRDLSAVGLQTVNLLPMGDSTGMQAHAPACSTREGSNRER